MEFEVAPRPLGSARVRRSLAIAIGALAVVAGLAIVGRPPDPPARGPLDAAVAGPTQTRPPDLRPGAASPAVPSTAGGPSRGRPVLPGAVSCHELTAEVCAFAVEAAVRALPDGLPPISTIGAWQSLICGDSFDCPPRHLAGRTAVGSVVVAFADGGPDAWINVTAAVGTVVRARGPQARLAEPDAWLVRWDE